MNKKGTVKIVIALNILFIVLALCTEVYLLMFEDFSILNATYGCIDAALFVAAFFYLVKGRNKNAAGYFKMFSRVYVLRLFINAVFSGVLTDTYRLSFFPEYTKILTNLYNVLPLVSATMIATCKDLGRKKSFALVIIAYVCCMVPFLFALIRPFGNVSSIDTTLYLYVARPGLLALITSILGIMVIEKYQDKATRNTD